MFPCWLISVGCLSHGSLTYQDSFLFPTSFYQLFFFPLFRVSSMNLSGLSITSPICHLIHFFCFCFSLRKLGHFLFLFTRFYLQTLILISRFGYKFSAFLYKFVFCASPAFCYIRTLKAIRTIPRITATAPMPPLNFPKSVSALPLD